MAANIKKGDNVVVITGRDKGSSGEVIRVMPKEGRALVRGVNMVKRHQSQTAAEPGRPRAKEAPIHLSNVAHRRSRRRQADARRIQVPGRRAQGAFREALGRDDQWLKLRSRGRQGSQGQASRRRPESQQKPLAQPEGSGQRREEQRGPRAAAAKILSRGRVCRS